MKPCMRCKVPQNPGEVWTEIDDERLCPDCWKVYEDMLAQCREQALKVMRLGKWPQAWTFNVEILVVPAESA